MGHNYIIYAYGKLCLEVLAHVCHVFPEHAISLTVRKSLLLIKRYLVLVYLITLIHISYTQINITIHTYMHIYSYIYVHMHMNRNVRKHTYIHIFAARRRIVELYHVHNGRSSYGYRLTRNIRFCVRIPLSRHNHQVTIYYLLIDGDQKLNHHIPC